MVTIGRTPEAQKAFLNAGESVSPVSQREVIQMQRVIGYCSLGVALAALVAASPQLWAQTGPRYVIPAHDERKVLIDVAPDGTYTFRMYVVRVVDAGEALITETYDADRYEHTSADKTLREVLKLGSEPVAGDDLIRKLLTHGFTGGFRGSVRRGEAVGKDEPGFHVELGFRNNAQVDDLLAARAADNFITGKASTVLGALRVISSQLPAGVTPRVGLTVTKDVGIEAMFGLRIPLGRPKKELARARLTKGKSVALKPELIVRRYTHKLRIPGDPPETDVGHFVELELVVRNWSPPMTTSTPPHGLLAAYSPAEDRQGFVFGYSYQINEFFDLGAIGLLRDTAGGVKMRPGFALSINLADVSEEVSDLFSRTPTPQEDQGTETEGQ